MIAALRAPAPDRFFQPPFKSPPPDTACRDEDRACLFHWWRATAALVFARTGAPALELVLRLNAQRSLRRRVGRAEQQRGVVGDRALRFQAHLAEHRRAELVFLLGRRRPMVPAPHV